MRRSINRIKRILPNLMTLAALCCGLSAIRFAHEGAFFYAAMLILTAAVLDFADGMTARSLRTDSDFGAELDTLADFVNFGVAPSIYAYLHTLQQLGTLGWAICLIYAIAAGLRLARFNVASKRPSERFQQDSFVGMPTPCAALLVVTVLLVAEATLAQGSLTAIAGVALVLLSSLMLSKQRTPKLTIALMAMRSHILQYLKTRR